MAALQTHYACAVILTPLTICVVYSCARPILFLEMCFFPPVIVVQHVVRASFISHYLVGFLWVFFFCPRDNWRHIQTLYEIRTNGSLRTPAPLQVCSVFRRGTDHCSVVLVLCSISPRVLHDNYIEAFVFLQQQKSNMWIIMCQLHMQLKCLFSTTTSCEKGAWELRHNVSLYLAMIQLFGNTCTSCVSLYPCTRRTPCAFYSASSLSFYPFFFQLLP